MALVDLRGRETEPEVLALLEPQGSWSLVGWSRDGVLVACAGIERVDGEELAVRALASHDDDEAASLLDAIAGVATGARIVAGADASRHDVYVAAGFSAEPGRDGLVRMLAEAPAPAASTRAATLHDVEQAVRAAWSLETSDDPDESEPELTLCC